MTRLVYPYFEISHVTAALPGQQLVNARVSSSALLLVNLVNKMARTKKVVVRKSGNRSNVHTASNSRLASKNIVMGKKPKRPRKTKPGMKALRQIREYQKSCDLLLRKLPFQRLVREMTNDLTAGNEPYRFQLGALLALQVRKL